MQATPATAASVVAFDEVAFCAELTAQTPALLGLARRMLGDPADAADAVQDALVRAWTRRHTLLDPAARRGWLRRIVVRECLRTLRWRRVRRWLPLGLSVPDRAQPAPHPQAHLDAMRVRALVEQLSPRQRQLWGLRFDEGWTLPEIAQATGIGTQTVKTHLARALATVRDALEAHHV